MKKIVILVAILWIIPSVSFAAWWNPFSWGIFHRDDKTQNIGNKLDTPTFLDTSATHLKDTKFYVKYDNSRIRNCPSTECDVIGYYMKNSEIIVQGEINYKLSDLPEWMLHTTFEGLEGYINRSILSETPVSEQVNGQQILSKSKKETGTNGLSDADMNSANDWIIFINREIQSNLDLISQVKRDTPSIELVAELLDIIESYVQNLKIVKDQLMDAIVMNDKVEVIAILTKVQKLKNDFDIDFELSMNNSLRSTKINAENTRAQMIEDAYRQIEKEQQAINQARIDATNAYVEQYNAIRQQGAREGATEAVVNAQLNAAGLMRQINCSFSSVGGMTPGAGSVTCY